MDTIVGEYEFGPRSKEFFGKDIYQQDVPCAVCKTKRPNVLMIPARNQLYNGWAMEYKGYLVGGHHAHPAASAFICLDGYAEVIYDGAPDQRGQFFNFAEAMCGSLKCPPYVEGRSVADYRPS